MLGEFTKLGDLGGLINIFKLYFEKRKMGWGYLGDEVDSNQMVWNLTAACAKTKSTSDRGSIIKLMSKIETRISYF